MVDSFSIYQKVKIMTLWRFGRSGNISSCRIYFSTNRFYYDV